MQTSVLHVPSYYACELHIEDGGSTLYPVKNPNPDVGRKCYLVQVHEFTRYWSAIGRRRLSGDVDASDADPERTNNIPNIRHTSA